MAEIRPLRAWRYSHRLRHRIDELTSPLFDVVSEKQRQKLYQEPLNSIHLSVPQGESSAKAAAQTLTAWKKSKSIVQDAVPGIYTYFQHFALPGQPGEFTRKGFIAFVRAYDWEDGVLLRHESTMPHSVNDRVAILEETKLNVAPTHGLYTDFGFEIESILDASMKTPIYESEDYQGVRDQLGVINDVGAIKRIIELMKDKSVILADGHHRYEGSLRHSKVQQALGNRLTGREAFNYHLMYFTNTEGSDLRILPTHRMIKDIPAFDASIFLLAIGEYFTVRQIDNPSETNEIISGKKNAFGLLIGSDAYKIVLKPGYADQIEWKFPGMIKELDLTILHYFILEKVLGIPGKFQTTSNKISFERNFFDCVSSVQSGHHQVAVITNAVSIDTIKKVCYSGYTLPQKSTYFYPKVICGFLFGSIEENEFTSPFDSCF